MQILYIRNTVILNYYYLLSFLIGNAVRFVFVVLEWVWINKQQSHLKILLHIFVDHQHTVELQSP